LRKERIDEERERERGGGAEVVWCAAEKVWRCEMEVRRE
jgi:hypothetical protein